MIERNADVAVVGAGIAGLAVALAAARVGCKVVLFERNNSAVGASIRNFGLVWPVGQPMGPIHDLAMRSREIWMDVIQSVGLFHALEGALFLAYEADEEEVLHEYLENLGPENYGRRWVDRKAVSKLSPAAITSGLCGAMHSPTEINIDPREAIRKIPQWLAERFGVELRFGNHVRAVADGRVETAHETWRVDQAFVCSGQDFESLYPEVFAKSGLKRVKLQMLRTKALANGWQLGPALCGALTMAHYESFCSCPSVEKLKKRLVKQHPFEIQHGIHLLVSQTKEGELTLGDSHHVAQTLDPFDREDIAEAIREGVNRFARFPSTQISERWHGMYAKCPSGAWLIEQPTRDSTILNGLGGGGMTLSFALAEQLITKKWIKAEHICDDAVQTKCEFRPTVTSKKD